MTPQVFIIKPIQTIKGNKLIHIPYIDNELPIFQIVRSDSLNRIIKSNKINGTKILNIFSTYNIILFDFNLI